jgi:hypothetical protein
MENRFLALMASSVLVLVTAFALAVPPLRSDAPLQRTFLLERSAAITTP